MVHVEGPGGEELSPRERSRLNDHERHAIDRFRCPSCGAPMDLLEQEQVDDSDAIDDDSCELVAACRQCMVTMSQDDWHALHQIA